MPSVTVFTAALVALSTSLAGQRAATTIPELVKRGAVEKVGSVPSGDGPSMSDVLRQTELIVVGILESTDSYLSPDHMEIWTDLQIDVKDTLFDRGRTTGAPPTRIAVTIPGGTATVDGVLFTQSEPSIPAVKLGTRVFCLLRRSADRVALADRFLGLFDASGATLTAVTAVTGFAKEFRDMETGIAIAEISRMATQLPVARK